MPKEDWVKNTIPSIMKQMGLECPHVTSVLDVGAGLSFKAQYIPADVYIAFDAYSPFLEAIETDVSYIPIIGNAKNLNKIFLPNSFDIVVATDILEHMDKKDSLQMLKDLESIAKVMVFIETPQGYIPQDIDIWGKGGHTWQTHRSEWQPEELAELGYRVISRKYKMSNADRHSTIKDIERDIVLIDGLKLL